MHRRAITRRSFARGAACAGALLLPGRARATPERPTILVIGGSAMVGALGRLIAEGLDDAGYEPVREAKISSGLARPDFFNWPARARALHDAKRPAATVCMFGGNDGQGLYMGKDADPPWIRWHEPGWSEEYARRVRALARAVAPRDEHLFWIGMPAMGSYERSVRMRRMNGIFVSEIGSQPRGHFIDSWPLSVDGRGRYADTIEVRGRRLKVRADDGVHFTRAGAELVAELVLETVCGVL